MKNSYFQYLHMRNMANFSQFYSAGCHGNGACKQNLTKFMLLLGGHNHCVKVSSDSEMVRGMGLWEFSGALRELMLISKLDIGMKSLLRKEVSEQEFYGDIVYKLKKIVGSNIFSVQFIRIISLYKKIG